MPPSTVVWSSSRRSFRMFVSDTVVQTEKIYIKPGLNAGKKIIHEEAPGSESCLFYISSKPFLRIQVKSKEEDLRVKNSVTVDVRLHAHTQIVR